MEEVAPNTIMAWKLMSIFIIRRALNTSLPARLDRWMSSTGQVDSHPAHRDHATIRPVVPISKVAGDIFETAIFRRSENPPTDVTNSTSNLHRRLASRWYRKKEKHCVPVARFAFQGTCARVWFGRTRCEPARR
jgi:hypothetical protein